jgi:predicted nucleic acid-binding protein
MRVLDIASLYARGGAGFSQVKPARSSSRREIRGCSTSTRFGVREPGSSGERRSRCSTVQDTWIAATARAHDAAVYTQDGDFDSLAVDVVRI